MVGNLFSLLICCMTVPMGKPQKIALVTGANRGIGQETSRQLARLGFHVLITSRELGKAELTATAFRMGGLSVEPLKLDVTDVESVRQAFAFIESQYGRIDVVINNAGISADVDGFYEPPEAVGNIRYGHTILDIPQDKLISSFTTNAVGAILVSQVSIPIMRKNHYGRIVNVSSQMGQFENIGTDWPAYRISKQALNVATVILAKEVEGDNILVNGVSPGWVKTDMGGPRAPRTVEQGAATIIWAATLPNGGPNGRFFKDRHEISW